MNLFVHKYGYYLVPALSVSMRLILRYLATCLPLRPLPLSCFLLVYVYLHLDVSFCTLSFPSFALSLRLSLLPLSPYFCPPQVPLWMFPLACVAGNTFLMKPSERTPLSSLIIARCIQAAQWPPGVFNVVVSD